MVLLPLPSSLTYNTLCSVFVSVRFVKIKTVKGPSSRKAVSLGRWVKFRKTPFYTKVKRIYTSDKIFMNKKDVEIWLYR